MNKQILFIIATALIIISAGIAVFLFYQNQDLRTKLDKKTKELATCLAKTCPNCENCENSTTYPIKVYFSKSPESDEDPTKVYAIDRTSPSIAVATYAISQLIAGPTATEKTQGYYSDVRVKNETSSCSDKDFKITISGGAATLQFCRTFDAVGTMSDARAEQIIKASLLQFPTVNKVIILSKTGNCQFDASGQNLCLE